MIKGQADLKTTLSRSACLERALSRMSETRELEHPTNGSVMKLYSFSEQKCFKHLMGKYLKIRLHLAHKYIEENKGTIL